LNSIEINIELERKLNSMNQD